KRIQGTGASWARPGARRRARSAPARRGRRRGGRAVPPAAGAASSARARGGRTMIALLEGTLAEKAPDRVVLSVNGVGYEVQVAAGTLAALPPPGKRARLFTRLHVREDAMLL